MTYIENIFLCMVSPLLVAALCMGRRHLRFFLFCIVHNIFCRFLCFTIGCLHYYRLTNIHPGYHSA